MGFSLEGGDGQDQEGRGNCPFVTNEKKKKPLIDHAKENLAKSAVRCRQGEKRSIQLSESRDELTGEYNSWTKERIKDSRRGRIKVEVMKAGELFLKRRKEKMGTERLTSGAKLVGNEPLLSKKTGP